MSEKTKKLWTDDMYLTLWCNGTILLSDGVGYSDTLQEYQVRELYEEMDKLFNGGTSNDRRHRLREGGQAMKRWEYFYGRYWHEEGGGPIPGARHDSTQYISSSLSWRRVDVEQPCVTPQPAPVVERPEPLIDEFANVKCVQWNSTERVIFFKSMMVLRKADHLDWLRRAVAWCEQEDKQ